MVLKQCLANFQQNFLKVKKNKQKMMLIKGKRAEMQVGRANSHQQPRNATERQRHWPGLLPVAYPGDQAAMFLAAAQQQQFMQNAIGNGTSHFFKNDLQQMKQSDMMNGMQQNRLEDSVLQGSVSKNNELNTGRLLDNLGSSSAGPGEQQLLLMHQYQSQPDDNSLILQQTSQEGSQFHTSTMPGLQQASQTQQQVQASYQSSVAPAQNPQMGIAPPGMGDLASFFMQPGTTAPHHRQVPGMNLNQAGVTGQSNGSSFTRPNHKPLNNRQESEVHNNNNSSSDNNQSKSQNANNLLGGGGSEFSPDNTQFTILKAKLFNPQINNPPVQGSGGVGTSGGAQLAQENSHSTSHHSTNQPAQSTHQSNHPYHQSIYNKIANQPPNMVPAHILHPPKIDESQLYLKQQQQQMLSQNLNLLGSVNNSSGVTNQNPKLAQKYSSAATMNNINYGYPSQTQLPHKYGQPMSSQGTNASRIQHNQPKPIDLGRQLKHKKDMQQLKFYQTLTSQAHLTQQPKPLSKNTSIGTSTRQIIPQFQQTAVSAQQLAPQNRIMSAGSAGIGHIQQQQQLNSSGLINHQSGFGSIFLPQIQPTSGVNNNSTSFLPPGGRNKQVITSQDPQQAMIMIQPPTVTASKSPVTKSTKSPFRVNAEPADGLLQKKASEVKSAIMVKDGDSALQSRAYLMGAQLQETGDNPVMFNAGSDMQMDIDQIQSINQHRPQTTVMTGSKKSDKRSSIMDDNNSHQALHEKSATQRDLRHHQSGLQEKSLTQMLSEGSRDDQMVLKPAANNLGPRGHPESHSGVVDLDQPTPRATGLEGVTNSGLHQISEKSPTFDITQNQLTLLENTQAVLSSVIQPEGTTSALAHLDGKTVSQEFKRPSTMAQASQPIVAAREIIEAQSQAAYGISAGSGSQTGVINKQASGGFGSVSQKRRQLISIDSTNLQKKRMFGDIADVSLAQGAENASESASPNGIAVAGTLNTTIQKGFITGNIGTLQGSIEGAENSRLDDRNNISGSQEVPQNPQHPSHVTLLQRQKMQGMAGGLQQSQFYIDSGYNSITAKIQERNSSAPAFKENLIIKKCEFSQRTQQLLNQKEQPILKKANKKRRESIIALINQDKFNQLAGITGSKKHQNHTACQRFLERGNNPVPSNYEEQDILPMINERTQQPGGTFFKGFQTRQSLNLQNNGALSQGGGTNKANVFGKQINIEDFDEEINGINLSKLFNAYGPSSFVDKDGPHGCYGAMRNHTQPGGPRAKPNSSISPNALRNSLGALKPTSAAITYPSNQGAIDDGEMNHNNRFDDLGEDVSDNCGSEDEDADFSNFQEPIVIRLMANMFSQKKSVKEGIEMLPEISLDKIRRDLDYMRAQERARLEKEKRITEQWDRHLKAAKFIQKFPTLLDQSSKYQQLMEYGDDIQEIMHNPFYIALKENKVERERLQLIKDLQKIQNDPEYDKNRQKLEEELKNKATEAVKTDIFKHTFVDAENLNIDEDIYPAPATMGIMNRPPKDVFTFMNLNFDLPSAYYQSFGDFSLPTDQQRDLIKNFMVEHWPSMKNKKLNFKIAYDENKRVFNTILLGKNCPLSKCCKMTVCFQFDKEIGGKVLCMETLCPYNPLDQFFMPSMDMIEELFRDTDSLVLQQSKEAANADSAIAPSQQHPRLRKIMAMEVSKTISKGLHKNGKSIREMLLRSALLNEAFAQIQNSSSYAYHSQILGQMIQQESERVQSGTQRVVNNNLHERTTIHEEATTEEDGGQSLENINLNNIDGGLQRRQSSSKTNIAMQVEALERQYQLNISQHKQQQLNEGQLQQQINRYHNMEQYVEGSIRDEDR